MSTRNYGYGKTELHSVAELGKYERVLELLNKGANIRCRDVFQETPLHYAAENGHLEIVQALVEAGSDISSVDQTKRTPLACALQRKRRRWEEVSAFLKKEEVERHQRACKAAAILPDLELIWRKSYIDTPCQECGGNFDVEAPVRTFSLWGKDVTSSTATEIPSIIVGDTCLAIHNRHIGCVPKNRIIVVSHVWHREVATALVKHTVTPEATQLAFEIPSRILHTAAAEWGPDTEIWHDYISTPQFEHNTQQKLLILLPSIFLIAARTLVHFQDVSITAINQMQNGLTSRDKLDGMMTILTGKWYTRLWTTLEMVHSRIAHVVTLEYTILTQTEDLLIGEIDKLFLNIVHEYGDIVEAEKAACNGIWPVPLNTFLPWKIKPMMYARRKPRMPLGASYEILLDRQCTVQHDLFCALLGLTGLTLAPGATLPKDDVDACREISFLSIEAGDCSPLLLQPMVEELNGTEEVQPNWLKGYKCYSLQTWGIGDETSPPRYPPKINNGKAILQVEAVGIVSWAHHFAFYSQGSSGSGVPSFLRAVEHAFAVTGRNMYDFVHTVGTNMYGMDTPEILERLNDPIRKATVLKAFDLLDRGGWDNWRDERVSGLAEAMGLSVDVLQNGMSYHHQYNKSPLEYACFGGGTPHNGNRSCLLTAVCGSCHKSSIFRAGMWAKPSEILGATLYRIPELQYALTLKNGVGMIVKDKKILGRMIYGTPACQCCNLEVIELD